MSIIKRAIDEMREALGFRSEPVISAVPPCPATQAVHRERTKRYRATHRHLLAFTGRDLPAVERITK